MGTNIGTCMHVCMQISLLLAFIACFWAYICLCSGIQHLNQFRISPRLMSVGVRVGERLKW